MDSERRYVGMRDEEDGMLSPKCPPHRKNKKKRILKQRFLGAAMLFFGSAALILCVLLLILPLFHVQSVEITGIDYYSEAQIIKAAGIRTGGETLATDAQKLAGELLKNAPYVQSCKISVLPFSIKVEIVEKEDVMYVEYDEEFVTFEYRESDHSFRVLEVRDTAPDGFRYASLPQISSAKAGGRITFTRESLDVSYVGDVIESLKHYGIYDGVIGFDFSSRSNLSYELESGCSVKLGTLEELDQKVATAIDLYREHPGAKEIDVRDLDVTAVR